MHHFYVSRLFLAAFLVAAVLKLQPARIVEAFSYWNPRKDDAPLQDF